MVVAPVNNLTKGLLSDTTRNDNGILIAFDGTDAIQKLPVVSQSHQTLLRYSSPESVSGSVCESVCNMLGKILGRP